MEIKFSLMSPNFTFVQLSHKIITVKIICRGDDSELSECGYMCAVDWQMKRGPVSVKALYLFE